MAFRWRIKPGRLRLFYIQFIIVFTLGYLYFLRCSVFQRKGITEGNFNSENELGRNIPKGHPSFPRATHSDGSHPTSNVTVSDDVYLVSALRSASWVCAESSASPSIIIVKPLPSPVIDLMYTTSWNRKCAQHGTGNKNVTQRGLNVSRFMDGCPEGWHLEILREANNQQHTAQFCSSNSGNGRWKCAPGWRKLSFDPFCIRSLSSSKLLERMSTILQPKYAPVSHSRKLLFIHVPKAGGTSIQTSFLFHDQRVRLGGHYLGGHHKITKFDKQFFKSYHKFCIVRHPCSRLISAWAFYAQGLGNARNKQWADEFMDNETKSSFNAFVERTLYPGGPVKVGQQAHLQTQIGMLFDKKGVFGLDQLLIYEKWEDSMDQLGKRINVNVTTLKSTHKNFSRHKTCQESYTSKTWAKMTQIYAMDFCVLGYSTEPNKVNVTPPIDLTPEDLTARFHECARKTGQDV